MTSDAAPGSIPQPPLDLESVPADRAQWAHLQRCLAGAVEIPPGSSGYHPHPGDLVFGLDVEYAGDRAYAALDAHRWGEGPVGRFAGVAETPAPYVPGFFCFREGPPLLALIRAVGRRFSPQPALLLVDGHGTAHPRRFGVACWLGIHTGLATIGCAKETLIRYAGHLPAERGSHLLIEDEGEPVGAALRTQDGIKPVFVSPGHKVSVRTAMDVVLHLCPRYRLPDPLRRAHQGARARAKGVGDKGTTWLGELDWGANICQNGSSVLH